MLKSCCQHSIEALPVSIASACLQQPAQQIFNGELGQQDSCLKALQQTKPLRDVAQDIKKLLLVAAGKLVEL